MFHAVKLYEMSYLIHPDIKEEELENIYVQKVKDLLSEFSGEIIKEQSPQKRKLSYWINKVRQGYFGYMLFNIDPKDLKALDKKLKLEESLLRYMIIAVDKNYSAHMKRQEEEIKEKFQRITQQPSLAEGSPRKIEKSKEKVKLEEEIEKKLEEILN